MNDVTVTSVENDLGLPRGRALSTPARLGGSGELGRLTGELQRHTDSLMNASVPEGLVQKVLDVLAPSAVRQEKRRGDRELVKLEVDSRLAIQKAVKDAQVQEMRILADAYVKTCQLAAAKVVAARGLEAAERVDELIEQSGHGFDQAIDQAVDKALSLTSESARESAAHRIQQRRMMRAEVERAVMEGVQAAIRGGLPPR